MEKGKRHSFGFPKRQYGCLLITIWYLSIFGKDELIWFIGVVGILQ